MHITTLFLRLDYKLIFKFISGSQLHLLGNCAIFEELRCIDLSDNDIYDIIGIVTPFASLKHLTSLQLEGNPCSVSNSTK